MKQLPSLTVTFSDTPISRNQDGTTTTDYVPGQRPTTQIVVWTGADDPLWTLMHELGHWFDFDGKDVMTAVAEDAAQPRSDGTMEGWRAYRNGPREQVAREFAARAHRAHRETFGR